MKLSVTVNGERREAAGVWEGASLLTALRDDLGLPGSKNACEQGECGSCSVYLDGTLVCSCLVLAAQAEGREVTTVEGIADGDALHPVQAAMVEAGAVQCGFCTPGFVVAGHDLLRRNPNPTEPEIREALAGNLCRCTGYEKIIDAVQLAAARLRGRDAATLDGPAANGTLAPYATNGGRPAHGANGASTPAAGGRLTITTVNGRPAA
jgi:carbon-monoxide dehydrogenase small subunit